MDAKTPVPLPARLTDPRPLILSGIAGWIVATIVVVLVGERFEAALPVCFAGLGVSAFGVLLYLAQRQAFRRGSRTAQRGLS